MNTSFEVFFVDKLLHFKESQHCSKVWIVRKRKVSHSIEQNAWNDE
jgi:hypothetical protein